jgi:putative heme-binding domain-containing protein
LALARTGDATLQPELLGALEAMDWQRLGSLRGEWLRVSALAVTRLGGASPETKQRWRALLSPRFPTGDRSLDAALCELLVFLEDPEIATRAVARLSPEIPRQEQMHYARCLSVLRVGWTAELRGIFFDSLGRASGWRGGASFGAFLNRIRSDALSALPEDEREGWSSRMKAIAPAGNSMSFTPSPGRAFVRDWKLAELLAVAERSTKAGSVEKGRQCFAAAGCALCHSVAGEGGAVGMDLTAAARRLSTRELLEAIVDPSKEISDQYGSVLLLRRDGSQLQGRVVNHTAGYIHLSENLFDPAAVTKVPEGDIESIARSKVSLMPAGLLNVLESDEILDLIAFLKRSAEQP